MFRLFRRNHLPAQTSLRVLLWHSMRQLGSVVQIAYKLGEYVCARQAAVVVDLNLIYLGQPPKNFPNASKKVSHLPASGLHSKWTTNGDCTLFTAMVSAKRCIPNFEAGVCRTTKNRTFFVSAMKEFAKTLSESVATREVL